MRAKFITKYYGKLVRCYVDFSGQIIVDEDLGESVIGNVGRKRVYAYTGRTDKIGNEIYEGHILYLIGEEIEVKWNKGLAGFELLDAERNRHEWHLSVVTDYAKIVSHIEFKEKIV